MARVKSNFAGGAWEKAKFIMALLCLIIMVIQVKSGIDMINANNNLPPLVTDFDSVSAGQSIRGVITHFEGMIDTQKEMEVANGAGKLDLSQSGNIEEVNMYVYVTESKHILIFRTKKDTPISSQLSELNSQKRDSVQFRGYVREMKDNTHTILNTYLIYNNFMKKNDIPGSMQAAITGLEVDITTPDDKISDKAITATFIGAVLMLLLALLLLRKSFKDMVETLYFRKHPEKEKRLLSRDGVIFENEGMYKGAEDTKGEFFVNTEHNIRGEGNLSKEPEDLMTHMISEEELFYQGGLNEEGNFYVDSENKTVTGYGDPDEDNMLKKY